ncbi:hypothetical protein [Nocardia goodfellowii]|uniref:Uncharacterized protein n=1 Tax=Nocardia goodfellowii TaxID=882446 RepID=A0ABS4QNP4_9NOCA|nr:hypothetical protein [Nocardia goodfellowii]MBP2193323.1 hypothetical protein [Nocardia goodfellowii]
MVFITIIGVISVFGAVVGFASGDWGFGFSCLGFAVVTVIIAGAVRDTGSGRARTRGRSGSWRAGSGILGSSGGDSDSGSDGGGCGGGCGGGG